MISVNKQQSNRAKLEEWKALIRVPTLKINFFMVY